MPANIDKKLVANYHGKLGEKIAKHYLLSQKYRVLYSNFSVARVGEIDLIARQNKELCFIEVKTRTDNHWGLARAAVNQEKQIKIKKTSHIWLRQLKLKQVNHRFDIIEIYLYRGKLPKIEHITYAFR